MLGPEIVHRQVAVGQVALSPDGETVVFGRRTVEHGRDVIRLWRVPWRGGRAVPLTGGGHRDTGPAFAPDGTLGFLSDRTGAPQVHTIALDGGEAVQATSFATGVTEFAWTPASAIVAVVPTAVDEDPVARSIATGFYRVDGVGYIDGGAGLHLVRPGGRARLLASLPRAVRSPVPIADDRVAFLADLDPGSLWEPLESVHVVDRAGAVSLLATTGGTAWRLAADVDGDGLVVLGDTVPDPQLGDAPRLHHLALDGTLTLLSAPDERVGDAAAVTDLADLVFGGDAGRVTHRGERGLQVPVRFAVDGTVIDLCDPALDPLALDLAVAGDRVVASLCLGARPPEVYALAPGRTPRRLTRLGGRWHARCGVETRRVVIAAPGGPIEAFLDAPSEAADEPLPTVLAIHGGPAAAWALAPGLEALLLAGHGYRVVRPNIAGSTGYGRALGDALVGAWGTRGAADCHAVLDHLIAAGLVDPARIGVSGLSFGGYLTNWLVATSDRFRAAVSENGICNLVSMVGTSDIGRWLDSGSRLGDPVRPDDVARLWSQSPLAHVAAITTPMLLLQGDADLRCPASEVEQLHSALLRLGRPVELVRYPGESHAMRFTGRPDRRRDRHERVLRFLDAHLRDG